MSILTRLKVYWSLLPANVRLAIHGAVTAAAGGAFTAGVVYFSDNSHHSLTAVRESIAVILAGATAAVALYFRSSPIPGWRWDKAVEAGAAIERRAKLEVPTPEVIVVPETPPGKPVPPLNGAEREQ